MRLSRTVNAQSPYSKPTPPSTHGAASRRSQRSIRASSPTARTMTGQGNRVGPLLRGSLVPFSHNTPTLSEPVEAVDRSANRRESADASSRTQWTHSPARTRVKKSIDLLESWTQGWCWAVARRATTDVPQQWGPGRMRAPYVRVQAVKWYHLCQLTTQVLLLGRSFDDGDNTEQGSRESRPPTALGCSHTVC